MRKPWMKDLQTLRFNAEGTMTQETSREQRNANRRQGFVGDSFQTCALTKDERIAAYAEAMGLSFNAAQIRIDRQQAIIEQGA